MRAAPAFPVWRRPVLVGLVGWTVLRILMEIASAPPGSEPLQGVTPEVAVLGAVAAGLLAFVDLRRSSEATLLENLGTRRGWPVFIAFIVALLGELALRLTGLVA